MTKCFAVVTLLCLPKKTGCCEEAVVLGSLGLLIWQFLCTYSKQDQQQRLLFRLLMHVLYQSNHTLTL